jgi:hypothetical protein
MSKEDRAADEHADDIVQRFVKERGDLYEEFHLFAREAPPHARADRHLSALREE